MHDALIKQGLGANRVSIGKPGENTAKDKFVPNKMSLGASRKVLEQDSAPAATPAPAAP